MLTETIFSRVFFRKKHFTNVEISNENYDQAVTYSTVLKACYHEQCGVRPDYCKIPFVLTQITISSIRAQ
jgi:hypothetical protein